MNPAELPPPRDPDAPIGSLVLELASHLGAAAAVEVCVGLMQGPDRRDHLDELRYLAGRSFEAGDEALDPAVWKDYWVRVWGARGLLYVWDDSAAPAVVAGLSDPQWRVAEMCLKVATRRELGEAGDGAAALAGHELARVRTQALRTLAVAGDTEHVAAVRARLRDPDPAVRRQAGRTLERLAERLDLAEEV